MDSQEEVRNQIVSPHIGKCSQWRKLAEIKESATLNSRAKQSVLRARMYVFA
jgi:hypothetical protein